MPIAGMQTTQLLNTVNNVKNFIKKKRNNNASSGFVDNKVLKLHYKYTFYFFTFIFLVVWNSWYTKDAMSCVNKYSAESQIRGDFLNICFTYIYTLTLDDTRRYLFFYRYMQYIVIFLAGMYYLIHKYIKNFEDLRTKKLCAEIAPKQPGKLNDANMEKLIYDRVPSYITKTMNTNTSLYYKSLIGCLLAIFVDIFTFVVLDYTLHNKFFEYGYITLPFNRDPENYMDYMSQTFPPFAQCTVSPINELIAKRSDTYGCHLTYMELYEKVFYFIWWWLVFCLVYSLIYTVHLLLLLAPCYRTVIRGKYKVPEFAEMDEDDYKYKIGSALKQFDIGDTYLLWRLQGILTSNQYFVVLCNVANKMDPDDVEVQGRNTSIDMPDTMSSAPKMPYPPQNMMGVPMTGKPNGVGWGFPPRR